MELLNLYFGPPSLRRSKRWSLFIQHGLTRGSPGHLGRPEGIVHARVTNPKPWVTGTLDELQVNDYHALLQNDIRRNSRAFSASNAIAQVSDSGLTFENPDPLQLALLDAEMLEQTASFAEQDGDQVDLDLI